MNRFSSNKQRHVAGESGSRLPLWVLTLCICSVLTSGCGKNSTTVARFFIESLLKGHEENARSCIVEGKAMEFDLDSVLALPGIPGVSAQDESSQIYFDIRRKLAEHLVFTVVMKSKTKTRLKCSYDYETLRKTFTNEGIGTKSFLQLASLEKFLKELKESEIELNLVIESGEWKVDPG